MSEYSKIDDCVHEECRGKIFESLDQALENGYELLGWEPEEIAIDLHDYDAQFENIDPALLVPVISEWQEQRRK